MEFGVVYPLILEKFVKKQKKSIEFFANVVKIFLDNFKNKFWNVISS